MNKTIIATAMAILAASFAMPVSGYHITPVASATAPGSLLGLTTNDFLTPAILFILCESEGAGPLPPADPVNPLPLSREGFGGLCYTGRNTATGAAVPPTLPGTKAAYTKLDLCSLTQATGGGGACPLAHLDGWAFGATLGVYACFVDSHQAFIYDEQYAYMTYGPADPVAVEGKTNGHVAAFPDLLFSNPVALATALVPNPLALVAGSAHTDALAAAVIPVALGGVPGTVAACGGSEPGNGPTFVQDTAPPFGL